MAINNLNPRRTVWFSLHEPSNKYDIWLSRNAHLDENGEPTIDSNAQRDCDYIFKIYDCGKWNPIVGFNSTAKFKINTVANVNYLYTYNGESYTSSGKSEFDLPLFTNGSPLELFSAGPLGVALNKFVTDEQWGIIYDNHLKTIIEQYPFELWLANTERIGGIKADTFDTIAANFVLVKFINSNNPTGANYGFLYVDPTEITNNSFNDPSFISDLLWLTFKNSPSIKKDWTYPYNPTSAQKPRFSIYGTHDYVNNGGKFLRLKTEAEIQNLPSPQLGEEPYNENRNYLDWVDIDEYLNNIEAGEGISITSSENTKTISIKTNGNVGDVLTIGQDDTVEWVAPPLSPISYTNGIGINIDNTDDSINIAGVDNTTVGKYLKVNSSGDDVEWDTVNEYEAGNGIDIDSNKILCNIETIDEGMPGVSLNVSWTTQRDSILVTDNSTYNKSVGLYEVYYNDTVADYTFSLISNSTQFKNNNPIYLRLSIKNINLIDGTKYIGDITGNGEYLVTIQFGIIKFEVIETYTSSAL